MRETQFPENYLIDKTLKPSPLWPSQQTVDCSENGAGWSRNRYFKGSSGDTWERGSSGLHRITSRAKLGRPGVTNGESLYLHSEDINSRQKAEVRAHRDNAGKSRKQPASNITRWKVPRHCTTCQGLGYSHSKLTGHGPVNII